MKKRKVGQGRHGERTAGQDRVKAEDAKTRGLDQCSKGRMYPRVLDKVVSGRGEGEERAKEPGAKRLHTKDTPTLRRGQGPERAGQPEDQRIAN